MWSVGFQPNAGLRGDNRFDFHPVALNPPGSLAHEASIRNSSHRLARLAHRISFWVWHCALAKPHPFATEHDICAIRAHRNGSSREVWRCGGFFLDPRKRACVRRAKRGNMKGHEVWGCAGEQISARTTDRRRCDGRSVVWGKHVHGSQSCLEAHHSYGPEKQHARITSAHVA